MDTGLNRIDSIPPQATIELPNGAQKPALALAVRVFVCRLFRRLFPTIELTPKSWTPIQPH